MFNHSNELDEEKLVSAFLITFLFMVCFVLFLVMGHTSYEHNQKVCSKKKIVEKGVSEYCQCRKKLASPILKWRWQCGGNNE